jgi:hypothetical protein
MLPYPIHEHSANEVETHFIKRLVHHLYLFLRLAVRGKADTNQMRRLYMYFTRILLAIVFVLFASTALAAKPDKTLVCHVGNEEGPGGEVYLDDPGCVPIEENEYFCPDAGKIDLIEVAKPGKHLDNDSHSYDGISDYLPGDIDASGEGKEDSNGDGVDDGCEPLDPLLACPCWDTFTETELVAFMDSFYAPAPLCTVRLNEAAAVDGDPVHTVIGANMVATGPDLPVPDVRFNRCGAFQRDGSYLSLSGLSEAVARICLDEANQVIPQIAWCADP